MRRPRRGGGTLRSESGASAVEFALVMVAAIPLMFGMLQYGLYFNDSLQGRQGARFGARAAVVQPTSFSGCTTGTYADQIRCYTKTQVNPVTGSVAVMVMAPDTGGWKKTNRLVVCTEVQSAGRVGIIPVPNAGVTRAETSMAIEQDAAVVSGFPSSDTALDGSWSWCS